MADGEEPKDPDAAEAIRAPASEPPIGDAVAELFGKLWKLGRGEVERVAKRGRERISLRQLKNDRDRMFQKLGKEALALLEGGEVDHPGLLKGAARIRELEARIREAEDQLRARGENPEAEPPGSTGEL